MNMVSHIPKWNTEMEMENGEKWNGVIRPLPSSAAAAAAAATAATAATAAHLPVVTVTLCLSVRADANGDSGFGIRQEPRSPPGPQRR